MFILKCILFLQLILISNLLFATTDHVDRINGFYEHSEAQKQFNVERKKSLDEFLEKRKGYESELEQQRQQFLEEKKKATKTSVSSERGPEYQDYIETKVKLNDEKEKAYSDFEKQKAQNIKNEDPRKVAWFEHLELGLLGNLDKNRVDPKVRYKPKTPVNGRGSAEGGFSRPGSGGGGRDSYGEGGSGGGGGNSGGGYFPPPPPPPPDDFDEGDAVPSPPVPTGE